jgi:adenosylmethionine-8-amino-7-oxononanoate aminotransferase
MMPFLRGGRQRLSLPYTSSTMTKKTTSTVAGIAGAPVPGRSLVERDLGVVWHPCTQMKDHEWLPLLAIERGEGVWLYDQDGRRYLDAISSWWVNLFGHANPRINAAITAQLSRLEHVLLAGCTHEPAVALAERLTRLAPAGLTRCFYADNGSSAIEVALKMSYHCWRNRGHERKRRFITLANSYHGETLGALAVGHVELYREIYQPLLMDGVITAPSPDAYDAEPGETPEDCARRAAAAMAGLLERHAAEVCAVIVEPVVQCAAGMRMHSPLYLELLRELCDRHDVHLIADEIAVGFGRTGTMFACEHAAVRPDFLCLSKGITGGYLPLSVVLTGDEVYEAFYDGYAKLRAFLHSHSYTGNALACTAALATLDIFESDAVLERNRALARHLGERARELLGDLPHVAQVRQAGMIVAAELARDGDRRNPFDWRERRGLRVYRHGLEHEALLRPIGNVVYFMPPYVITPGEIDALVAAARDGILAATADCPRSPRRGGVTVASAAATPAASSTGLEF